MITRTEFWQCQPFELWLLIEANTPEKEYTKSGMTESEVKEIYEQAYGKS